MRLFALLLAVFAATPVLAQYDPFRPRYNDVPEEAPWKEDEVGLPKFPDPGNLTEIYVSAIATNRYLIDRTSISVGKDQVVRFVLVVETSGGARNISFEGMRCKEQSWKLYATGHRDGTWAPARISEWRPIENKPVNRHHAAISRDLFCPNGSSINSSDEGVRALQAGKHPLAN